MAAAKTNVDSIVRYEVLDRINHDNKEYEAGAIIELPDEAIAALLKANVIKQAEA